VGLGEVAGVAALGAGRDLVAQPDVGERAADHHLVVAAPRPVRVEVLDLDPVLAQVVGGGRADLDRAGRGDVVGGGGVADLDQHPGAGDVGDGLGLARHAVEVRGLADVGGVGVPLEGVAGRDGQR